MDYYQTLINTSEISPLTEQRFDTPCIIIYPRHPNRSALVAYLIEKLDDIIIHYYALTDEDTSVRGLINALLSDPQFPDNFGRQTRQALDDSNDARAWAEALSDDLADLHSEDFLLILDQLDRVQYSDSNYSDFFLTFVKNLPSHIRLVANGRELYRHPWNEIIQSGFGRTFGQDNAIAGGMFHYETDLGVVEFYSLSGDIRVLSDGFQVTSWDGALPRNLCYFFIEHERVTRNTIFETFWPHLGIKEATNVFHVTKRKISEKLGYDITSYSGGFYIPSNDVTILYDAREFEHAYQSAMNDPDTLAPGKWYRAASLYRHPYLEGLDMPWVLTKREQLQNYYVQTLIELGRYNEKRGRQETALGYYLRAVSEKPEREDVHRAIMAIYFDMQDIAGVNSQYKFLEKELRRTYDIAPSKETRALYKSYTE